MPINNLYHRRSSTVRKEAVRGSGLHEATASAARRRGGWADLTAVGDGDRLGQQAVHRALALGGVAQHGLAQLRKTLRGLQDVVAQGLASVSQFVGLGRALKDGEHRCAGLFGGLCIAAQQRSGQAVQPRMQLTEPRVGGGQGFGRRLHGGGV
jgi:hypothetical protein